MDSDIDLISSTNFGSYTSNAVPRICSICLTSTPRCSMMGFSFMPCQSHFYSISRTTFKTLLTYSLLATPEVKIKAKAANLHLSTLEHITQYPISIGLPCSQPYHAIQVHDNHKSPHTHTVDAGEVRLVLFCLYPTHPQGTLIQPKPTLSYLLHHNVCRPRTGIRKR